MTLTLSMFRCIKCMYIYTKYLEYMYVYYDNDMQ